jgi:putative PIN family toxin of toxin-antitoxin system
MIPIQIVIDTNVLIADFRSRTGASNKLISTIGDPRWELNVSTALVLEYEAVLKRTLRNQGKPLQLADESLDALVAVANRRSIPVRYRPVLRDADDDFVLELALEAGAAYVVTFNIRDFEGLKPYGVGVVRPGEFLRILEGHP